MPREKLNNVQEIVAYRATDGRIFESEAEAVEHSNLLLEQSMEEKAKNAIALAFLRTFMEQGNLIDGQWPVDENDEQLCSDDALNPEYAAAFEHAIAHEFVLEDYNIDVGDVLDALKMCGPELAEIMPHLFKRRD